MKQLILAVAFVLVVGISEASAWGSCEARATAYVRDANGEVVATYFDSKDFGRGNDRRACEAQVENWFHWFAGQGCVWHYEDGAASVALYATWTWQSRGWAYAGPRRWACE